METLDASQVLDVRAPMADLGYGEEGLQTLLSGEVVLMPADQPIRPEDIKPGDSDEVQVRRYEIRLCDLCATGKGGYCNVPGCALIRNCAPDLPLVKSVGVYTIGWDSIVLLSDSDVLEVRRG